MYIFRHLTPIEYALITSGIILAAITWLRHGAATL